MTFSTLILYLGSGLLGLLIRIDGPLTLDWLRVIQRKISDCSGLLVHWTDPDQKSANWSRDTVRMGTSKLTAGILHALKKVLASCPRQGIRAVIRASYLLKMLTII